MAKNTEYQEEDRPGAVYWIAIVFFAGLAVYFASRGRPICQNMFWDIMCGGWIGATLLSALAASLVPIFRNFGGFIVRKMTEGD